MSSRAEMLGLESAPNAIQHLLQWRNLAALFVLYYAGKTFYRLYLSPLSKIPGRKLAAVTQLYAVYYDLICGGQYIWEIEKMHQRYGPIVRISPSEIHINDATYIDTVFAGPGHQRDKGQLSVNGLAGGPTALATGSHTLHKARRAALNPWFSTKNIRGLEPMIHEVLAHLNERLQRAKLSGEPVNLSLLYKAATHDLIADYAFGQGSVCFSREDLNAPYFKAYHEMVLGWHFGCYFAWVSQLTRALPPSVVAAVIPSATQFITMIQACVARINKIKESSKGTSDMEKTTIFHGMLASDLPEEEKTPERLAEEAGVLLSAGTDSSANTLSSITYHLLTNSRVLKKLQDELEAAMPDKSQRMAPALGTVEQLPYLSAVVQEGLRLHPAVSTRQQRVAPTEDLVYTSPAGISYTLPRGTILSMNPVLLSRDPSLYPNPQEFRPERFIENPRLRGYTLTFSRGTRICLGMQLAYQEMYVILAGLFGRYNHDHGKGERLELYKTDFTDIEIVRDLVTENTREGSVGVRILVTGQ